MSLFKKKKSSKHINRHPPPTPALPLVPHLDSFHLFPLYSSASCPLYFLSFTPFLILFVRLSDPISSCAGCQFWPPATQAFLRSETALHLLSLAIYSVHTFNCEAARVTRSPLPCYYSPLLKPVSLFAHLWIFSLLNCHLKAKKSGPLLSLPLKLAFLVCKLRWSSSISHSELR